jgi:hypothetical protein
VEETNSTTPGKPARQRGRCYPPNSAEIAAFVEGIGNSKCRPRLDAAAIRAKGVPTARLLPVSLLSVKRAATAAA